MDSEAYYKMIEGLKKDIEDGVFNRAAQSIEQISCAVRNSNAVHQERLEKLLLQSLNEIKDKIHDFELRLVEMEKGLWGKRHLYAMYTIVIVSILALLIK